MLTFDGNNIIFFSFFFRTSEGVDAQIDPKDVDIISGTVTVSDGQSQAFIHIQVNHDAQ